MKLSEYAKKNSISYRTAWRHFQLGLIPNARQLPSGSIVIDDEYFQEPIEEYTVIYARVSSSENKTNLESQAERLEQFCTVKGWKVNEVVKECASGLNDNRPKLIFNDRKATRLVVEHKDRLTRFGFNYIKTLYPECEIIVVNEVENKEDLFEDFVSLVTSFFSRIYGRRRSRRKTEELIKKLEKEEVDSNGDDETGGET
ncbi:MAG: IS607 family transposase [Selenomonadaceae bacterium]|nr:IS607 family transposase [Selenomonadaceae bacterium]